MTLKSLFYMSRCFYTIKNEVKIFCIKNNKMELSGF